MRQRLVGMRMRQRARLIQVQTAQDTEAKELSQQQQNEVTTLLTEQAGEVHAVMESVTAMIALGSKWAPLPKQEKLPWMVQLKKSRFHPSKALTEMQSNLTKLADVGGMSKLHELQQQVALPVAASHTSRQRAGGSRALWRPSPRM